MIKLTKRDRLEAATESFWVWFVVAALAFACGFVLGIW